LISAAAAATIYGYMRHILPCLFHRFFSATSSKFLLLLLLLIMALHLVALVLIQLVATATATASAAAPPCNPCNIANQVFLFCPYDISRRACCDVVNFVMDAGHADNPPCLCRLDDCEEFLLTGYTMDDLLTFYVGCGGERLGNALELVASCTNGMPWGWSTSATRSTTSTRHK
jgi:hypothetical protein